MVESAWSLLPPIITIVLALATKEVYMSLIVGIFVGALMFTGFDLLAAIDTFFAIMSDKVGENVYILVFLVLLGIIVAAIARSGASRAYGEWAASVIKGKRSSLLVTSILGVVIFIDDYFNCLTVGTVMRPVTDKFNVTRAKLAYIIDATAAPICIIAPVSSWAAAVSSSLPEDSAIDGFSLFLQTIPFNMYAWFTIIFMLFLIWTGKDFAAMKTLEKKSGGKLIIPEEYKEEKMEAVGNGKILDLLLPLIVLKGFRAMTPAIFILCLAWSLSGVCGEDYLNIGGYVGGIVSNNATVGMFMPAVFFLVAIGLALATGTSWGTFGILIPIALAVVSTDPHLLVVTVAAVLAGAVGGDHVSPISDTTILASAGAQCSHIDHVSTQVPYVIVVATCSFLGYLVAGIAGSGWIGVVAGFVLLAIAMIYIYKVLMKD